MKKKGKKKGGKSARLEQQRQTDRQTDRCRWSNNRREVNGLKLFDGVAEEAGRVTGAALS